MSNEMIRFARQLNFLAKELATETSSDPIKKQKILISPEDDRMISKELIAYRRPLRTFLSQEENQELFGRLKPLFDNPESKKPIIRPLTKMKSERKNTLESLGDYDAILLKLKDILRHYGTPSKINRFPSVKLLKEILNFLVVKGQQPFKKILSNPTILFADFKSHGKLEKQEEKGVAKS
jgi:hypothetical protein